MSEENYENASEHDEGEDKNGERSHHGTVSVYA